MTEAAIKKRIQRGSLSKELGEDGRVYVYLDLSRDASHRESQVDRDLLVEDLREQVHHLRSVLNEEQDARRRTDTIIAQLTQANAALAQRVPELPSERPAQSPTEWADDQEAKREDEDMSTRSGEQRQSWWSRVFGG